MVMTLGAMVGTGVASLLCSRRPPAVFWTVRAIVVDAFDGVLRGRARPHVLIESLEGIKPAVADGDTTGSPALPMRVVGVATALFHGLPDRPLGAYLSLTCHPVCSLRDTQLLTTEAATTSAMPVPKRRSVYFLFGAAGAAAPPTARPGSPEDNPPAEASARHLDKLWHISSLPQGWC